MARKTSKRAPARARNASLTRKRLLIVGGLAAALALALVAASIVSARGSDAGGDGSGLIGAVDVEAMLDGIPQSGNTLGDPDAPVTLVEYADLQCPFCAQWAQQTFPVLVDDYVRSGQLRIEFRGLTFIGPDSEDALRAALGAGEQDKLWNVVDLTYLNQGAENSGWVTEGFLRSVGAAIPGLDVDAMLAAGNSDAATTAMDEAAEAASAAGVSGTPAFEIGETGGELSRLEISSLEPEEFRAAIDEILGG